jgi:uncharacterized peroxidase-related enzyme
MMTFQVHTTKSAPQASRETLNAIQERYGFIPNLAGVFAESPGAFKGLLGAIQSFDDEALTLTPLERQVVLLAVAVENRCDYCTAAHGLLAHNLGLERDQIHRMHSQQTLADVGLEAVREFTTRIVRNRGWVEQEHVNDFLEAGFTNAQVLEILLGVSLKTLTNYANHITKPAVNAQFRDFLPNWEDAA